MGKYRFEEVTNKIIGCAIEVHKQLGSGLGERFYQRALLMELDKKGLSVETEKEIKIYYDGKKIGVHRLDLVVNNTVLVELKAARELDAIHQAQVLSYLKASGLKIGLLLNFAKPVLEIKRLVL